MENSNDDGFPIDLESLLAALARIFAMQGASKQVAILVSATLHAIQVSYDSWDGGIYTYQINVHILVSVYGQISNEREALEKQFLDQIQTLLVSHRHNYLEKVNIIPLVSSPDKDWRDKAKAWVAGEGISNQGRVRSDNIASRTCDGLLFRSQPEINLYRAFKKRGISFAPLPVFIQGGETYKRIEPDFVILRNGIVMVVEVDGDTVHHETPAEAHVRTTMLAHEGAHIERVKANDCSTPELAEQCAEKILQVLAKLKNAR